jgi:hypothetical protein
MARNLQHSFPRRQRALWPVAGQGISARHLQRLLAARALLQATRYSGLSFTAIACVRFLGSIGAEPGVSAALRDDARAGTAGVTTISTSLYFIDELPTRDTQQLCS